MQHRMQARGWTRSGDRSHGIPYRFFTGLIDGTGSESNGLLSGVRKRANIVWTRDDRTLEFVDLMNGSRVGQDYPQYSYKPERPVVDPNHLWGRFLTAPFPVTMDGDVVLASSVNIGDPMTNDHFEPLTAWVS